MENGKIIQPGTFDDLIKREGLFRSVKVEMRYAKEVRRFARKVEEAHEKAANSKLVFG